MCVVRTGACVYMCGVCVCVCVSVCVCLCVCLCVCVVHTMILASFLLFPIYYELNLLPLQRSVMDPM